MGIQLGWSDFLPLAKVFFVLQVGPLQAESASGSEQAASAAK